MVAAAPATLAQKLIAGAAGRSAVMPGDVVTCRVDLAMFHDFSGPHRLAPRLTELNAEIRDKNRVVLVIDHDVVEETDEARGIVGIARAWAAQQQLPHVHGSQGIRHVVLPQQGHLRPGMFCVGGDSHSPTGGAFGTYMFGIGATEMLGVVAPASSGCGCPKRSSCTGTAGWRPAWVPRTWRWRCWPPWHGRRALPGGSVLRPGGAGAGHAAPHDAGQHERRARRAGGTGRPDDTTRAWLAEHGVPHAEIDTAPWHSDVRAPGTWLQHDASTLAPQVARPHSPANACAVGELAGTRIDVAYIRACTGAKLTDLRAAAQVLAGRRIAPGVQPPVATASAGRGVAAQAGDRDQCGDGLTCAAGGGDWRSGAGKGTVVGGDVGGLAAAVGRPPLH